LIGFSKPYFHIEKSELADENLNEKWICKKCGSTYEFGWQDFSIAVEREKLKLTELKVEQIGKPAIKPIPLYIGLIVSTPILVQFKSRLFKNTYYHYYEVGMW
jgi:hypothetical protein